MVYSNILMQIYLWCVFLWLVIGDLWRLGVCLDEFVIWINGILVYLQATVDGRITGGSLGEAGSRTLFLMLMYVLKSKTWNIFGSRGRKKQIESPIWRANLQRGVESLVKMEKEERQRGKQLRNTAVVSFSFAHSVKMSLSTQWSYGSCRLIAKKERKSLYLLFVIVIESLYSRVQPILYFSNDGRCNEFCSVKRFPFNWFSGLLLNLDQTLKC